MKEYRMKITTRVFLLLVVFTFLFSMLDESHFNSLYPHKKGYLEHVVERFYFTIVTISTIGYGDVTPKTVVARLLTIALILCMIFSILY